MEATKMEITFKAANSLRENLGKIVSFKQQISHKDTVTIDCQWLDPFSVVAIAREVSQNNSSVFHFKSSSYQDIINFPNGTDHLLNDKGKSYLPLFCIPQPARTVRRKSRPRHFSGVKEKIRPTPVFSIARNVVKVARN